MDTILDKSYITFLLNVDGMLPKAVFFDEFQKNMQTEFNRVQIGSKDKNNWE